MTVYRARLRTVLPPGGVWRPGGVLRPGGPWLAWLVCAGCLALFFRADLLDGFGHVFGDINDARIEIALLEHWWNVLRGWEGWRQPVFLAPAKGVLGYNDGYFLFGMAYAAFRAVGADPFLAAEATHAAVRAAGFWAFLAFGRTVCRLPPGACLLGAAIFTLSNAMTMQMGHAQLLSVGFAPALGWLCWQAARALRERRERAAAAWGCTGALLFAAWAMTAFYMLWFTVFFTLLLGVAWLLLTRGRGLRAWRGIPLWPVLLSGAVLAAGMVPFLRTYLPAARATGMHRLAEAMVFVPAPLDLLNVGAHSWLFGAADAWLTQTLRPGAPMEGEWAVGMPWIMLAAAFAGCALAWRSRGGDALLWRVLGMGFVLALLVSAGVGGHSFWPLVFRYVPGAAAVRVVCRFWLFLGFPAALLAAFALSRRRWPLVLAALGCVLLVTEELNGQQQSTLDRRGELQFLARLPPPPAGCARFAVTEPRAVDNETVDYERPLVPNTDGMLVAELLHVPSLNGHASFLPRGFALGFGPGPAFGRRVYRAVLDHAVPGDLAEQTCGLDLAAFRWTGPPLPPPPAEPIATGVTLKLGGGEGNAGLYLLRGWGVAEETGRWTDGPVAEIAFVVPPGKALTVMLHASAFSGGGPPSPVSVRANGRMLATWRPAGPPEDLAATIPADLLAGDGRVLLSLAVAVPRRPRDFDPTLTDSRRLGLFVQTMRVE